MVKEGMIQPETINSMGGDSGVYENDGDFVRRSDAISVLEKISEGKLLSCPICGGRAKIRKIRVEESLVKRYKYRAFCWGFHDDDVDYMYKKKQYRNGIGKAFITFYHMFRKCDHMSNHRRVHYLIHIPYDRLTLFVRVRKRVHSITGKGTTGVNREQERELGRMAGSSDIVIPKQTEKLLCQASEMVQRELSKQRLQWNAFVKPGILSIFHTADLHSSFFVNRDSLRKRSNLSFDDRLFMKAPNNIEFRMPVALRKLDAGVEIFDPYGSMKVAIEEEPEYELTENKLYIMRMKKQFPMYPLCPVLDKNKNGLEMHLQPIPLPLYAEPEADSDFAYLAEQPDYIRNENEAADIITYLQNYYRLRDYLVERKDATTIVVNEKKFIISYNQNRCCLKLGIFY